MGQKIIKKEILFNLKKDDYHIIFFVFTIFYGILYLKVLLKRYCRFKNSDP